MEQRTPCNALFLELTVSLGWGGSCKARIQIGFVVAWPSQRALGAPSGRMHRGAGISDEANGSGGHGRGRVGSAARALDDEHALALHDITTAILHDVGNSVTSVGVSAERVIERLDQSRVGALEKLADMLDAHRHDLAVFLTEHPSGRQVPDFVQRLSETLARERDELEREAQYLRECLDQIRGVLTAQQERSRRAGVGERASIDAMVSVVLDVHAPRLAGVGAEVRCRVVDVPELALERHKLVEILSDLVSCAIDALRASDQDDPRIAIEAKVVRGRLRVAVSDNGVGFATSSPVETLRRVRHLASSMRGGVSTASAGPGRGATYEVDLPLGADAHGVGLASGIRRVSENTWRFG